MKKFLSSLFLSGLPLVSLATEQQKGIDQQIDEAFAPISNFFSDKVFYEIAGIPLVLIILVFSAAFFTLYFGFPNIRYFGINDPITPPVT